MERTLGSVGTNVAVFVCFIVMDLTGAGSGLTTSKIFSTLELMCTLRYVVFNLGISIGFYFELKIFFARFCTIMNIQDKRMVKID